MKKIWKAELEQVHGNEEGMSYSLSFPSCIALSFRSIVMLPTPLK